MCLKNELRCFSQIVLLIAWLFLLFPLSFYQRKYRHFLLVTNAVMCLKFTL